MNGFRQSKTSKHAKGHGRPKGKRPTPKSLTITAYPNRTEVKRDKPMSDLEAYTRFLMALEKKGYQVWDDDGE